jgi:hypothetical protein
MTKIANIYPVPGRTELRNRRICSHEIGHALLSRAIGDTVHEVSVIPDRGFEGRCVRSGPASALTLDDQCLEQASDSVMYPDEMISICERLERLTPEIGSPRIESAEFYIRGLNNVIALVAGEAAELLLHPDLPPLGAQHDFVEADAFAKITVIASPAVAAMVAYAVAEATAILSANIDVAKALVDALETAGVLSGEQVDMIIAGAIAARAADAERVRRNDWQQCQRNAAMFLETIPPDKSSLSH